MLYDENKIYCKVMKLLYPFVVSAHLSPLFHAHQVNTAIQLVTCNSISHV